MGATSQDPPSGSDFNYVSNTCSKNMHSMPSAPETMPITRLQSRSRGVARLPAFAILLVTLLSSALPTFGQTFVSQLGGMNGPTMVALDTRGSPATTWLYVSEHGETNDTGGGRILRFNLTSG